MLKDLKNSLKGKHSLMDSYGGILPLPSSLALDAIVQAGGRLIQSGIGKGEPRPNVNKRLAHLWRRGYVVRVGGERVKGVMHPVWEITPAGRRIQAACDAAYLAFEEMLEDYDVFQEKLNGIKNAEPKKETTNSGGSGVRGVDSGVPNGSRDEHGGPGSQG